MRLLRLCLPLLILAACSRPLTPLTVTSPMFAEGAVIPNDYTCDGRNILPPMSVAGVPADAEAIGVLMHDLDGEKGVALHLAMWNIDPKTTGLAELDPPIGAVYGQNDAGITGYSGPCRALDKPHRYAFTVYALEERFDLMPGADRAAIEAEFAANAVAKGMLTGLYGTSPAPKNAQTTL